MKTVRRINLQEKTRAVNGTVETYWVENEDIGLERTMFHRIQIPLNPFQIEIDEEPRTLETEIVFEWLKLSLVNPRDFHGLKISSEKFVDLESSVYIGNVHNPCDVLNLEFSRIGLDEYLVKGDLIIDFEHELVAASEKFSFETKVSVVANLDQSD